MLCYSNVTDKKVRCLMICGIVVSAIVEKILGTDVNCIIPSKRNDRKPRPVILCNGHYVTMGST